MSKKNHKRVSIGIRPQHFEHIEKAVKEKGVTYSDYVAELLVKALDSEADFGGRAIISPLIQKSLRFHLTEFEEVLENVFARLYLESAIARRMSEHSLKVAQYSDIKDDDSIREVYERNRKMAFEDFKKDLQVCVEWKKKMVDKMKEED